MRALRQDRRLRSGWYVTHWPGMQPRSFVLKMPTPAKFGAERVQDGCNAQQLEYSKPHPFECLSIVESLDCFCIKAPGCLPSFRLRRCQMKRACPLLPIAIDMQVNALP